MLRLRTALFLAVVAFGSAAVVATSPLQSGEITDATGAKLVVAVEAEPTAAVETLAWDCPEETPAVLG